MEPAMLARVKCAVGIDGLQPAAQAVRENRPQNPSPRARGAQNAENHGGHGDGQRREQRVRLAMVSTST